MLLLCGRDCIDCADCRLALPRLYSAPAERLLTPWNASFRPPPPPRCCIGLGALIAPPPPPAPRSKPPAPTPLRSSPWLRACCWRLPRFASLSAARFVSTPRLCSDCCARARSASRPRYCSRSAAPAGRGTCCRCASPPLEAAPLRFSTLCDHFALLRLPRSIWLLRLMLL